MVGAAVLALTGTVAGCSSDSGSDGEPIGGVETGAASGGGDGGQNGNGGEAADVRILKDLYRAYWDTLVDLENGAELDVAAFDGIATPGVAEDELGRLRAFREDNIRRQGEPAIDNVNVSIDGDTAHIESCKSEADWQFVVNGEVAEEMMREEAARPHPYVVSADRSSGEWLINATLRVEEATITC